MTDGVSPKEIVVLYSDKYVKNVWLLSSGVSFIMDVYKIRMYVCMRICMYISFHMEYDLPLRSLTLVIVTTGIIC